MASDSDGRRNCGSEVKNVRWRNQKLRAGSLKEREAKILKPRRYSSRVSAAERSLEVTSVRLAAALPALRRCSSEPTNQVRQTLPR